MNDNGSVTSSGASFGGSNGIDKTDTIAPEVQRARARARRVAR